MDRNWPGVDKSSVERLVALQFPEFAGLAITRVLPGGWDNLTFRLGDDLSARFPTAERYAPQIAREAIAFEALAGRLSFAIPSRVRTGVAGNEYPYDWAINRWLEGVPASASIGSRSIGFAQGCGHLLSELQKTSPSCHLPPDGGNFHRGGSLRRYDAEVTEALARLDDAALAIRAEMLWQQALSSEWVGIPRWVHGDFFPWNLLIDCSGQLSGVIDWGLVAVGDPACDLAVAWTCFDAAQREAFRDILAPDQGTWHRGRGWSLWKALTLATGVNRGPPDDFAQSRAVLDRICGDDA